MRASTHTPSKQLGTCSTRDLALDLESLIVSQVTRNQCPGGASVAKSEQPVLGRLVCQVDRDCVGGSPGLQGLMGLTGPMSVKLRSREVNLRVF